MAKSKLSDRERAAQRAGISVDYNKSAKQQVKSFQPAKLALPKTLASKTPQAKLYQAQKSQPIYQKSDYQPLPKGYSGPSAMKSTLAAIRPATPKSSKVMSYDDMVNPNSDFNQRQKQVRFQKNLASSQEQARRASEESENTKGYTGLSGLLKKSKEAVTNFGKEAKSGAQYAKELYRSGQKKKLYTEVTKPIASFFGGEQSEESRIAEERFRNAQSIEEKKAAIKKLASESGRTQANLLLNVFNPGKSAVGRAVEGQVKKKSGGIFSKVKSFADDMFSGVGKNIADNSRIRVAGDRKLGENIAEGGKRFADNVTPKRAKATEVPLSGLQKLSSKADDTNIRDIRFNEPKIGTPDFSPRTPKATRASERIVQNDTPRGIPRGRAELPKQNTNKADDLFEEADDLGRSKVFTNVREGDGSLKRVEVGEFDETGRFKEKTAEDGRPISEVIDEGNRNLASGKRGVTRLEAPSDVRAALKPFEKPKRKGFSALKSDMRDRVKRNNGRYAGSVKREVAGDIPEKTVTTKESEKGLLRKVIESRKMERNYLKQRDENIMLAIEEALPKLDKYSPDLNRYVNVQEDAGRLRETMSKLASNRKISDTERLDAMETLQRLGVGTKTHYNGDAVTAAETGLLRKGAIAKQGLKAEGAAKGRIATQNTDALIQKARKYESAEEFVNAQGEPVYHASKNTIKEFGDVPDSGTRFYGKGTYFSKNVDRIKEFGDNITEARLNLKNPYTEGDIYNKPMQDQIINLFGKKQGQQIIDSRIILDSTKVNGEKLAEMYKKAGYDGIIARGGNDIAVFNPKELVKTKSQLTDIWNKAHGGGKGMLTANASGAAGGFINEDGEVDFSQYNAKNALIGLGVGMAGIKASSSLGKKGLLQSVRESKMPLSGKVRSLGAGSVQGMPSPGAQSTFSSRLKTQARLSEKTSVSPPTPQNPRVSPSWVKEKVTSLREVVQDNWIRVKNLQKEVGKEINSKNLSPYQAETLMHGRTQARLDAVKEAITSIDKEISAVKDASFRKKVDQYLIAKHAPERNAVHGERAAGMSNDEASAILSEIGDNKEVKAVADKIKDLNYKTLEILKDSQVISEETYKTLRTTYKEHVPLNRIMDNTDLEQYLIGKGLDVKSSGLKRAKGSEREVADVLTNVTANLEQAVVRAEKNRVNLATLKFARENKAFGVFEEVKPKAIGQTFDGKPLLERVDDPNVLTVMENGKPVYLKIKDDKLAEAFKAVGNQKLPALFNFIGGFTRLYSGLATRFNPEFAFSNKLRDLQEMSAYMASQKGIGFSGAAKTAGRDIVSMADVTAGILGKDTAGARLYRQMVEDGGTTGGMALSTRKQLEIDIENIRQMNRAGIFNAKKVGQKFLSTIDSWNEVFENSTRLSVYKTALDKGMTRDQAAYLAKNSTINFNKKGTGGGIINSLYMFSNASIQGTTKLLSSMKNPKVATAVTAAVGSSVWATNQWNDSVDPEWRTKVDKWDRESNLIVALPTPEGAKYMTIPVSWGIKPMKVMADYAYDALNGKADQKTGFDVAGKVMGSLWNAYNPVGGSSLGSAIVPTIGDVPYDIATNTKWSGSMIRPTSKEGVPESENFFKNKEGVPSDKSGMFGMLARGTKSLASATGGEIQVNPASLKYAIDSYLSGAGRAVSGTAETISAISSDKELQTKDTPFLRRFLKEKTPEELEKSQKFGKKDTLHEELKRLPREKQPEKIQEYLNSIQDEDQRKGAAYGLMQEGFNTKGTSTSEAIIKMKPTYEKVKQLERDGKEDEAQSIVDNLSDEDYEKYKKVRASVRAKNTETFRELLKTDPKKAVEFNRAQDEEEGNRLIELLTDEEYDLYERGKL